MNPHNLGATSEPSPLYPLNPDTIIEILNRMSNYDYLKMRELSHYFNNIVCNNIVTKRIIRMYDYNIVNIPYLIHLPLYFDVYINTDEDQNIRRNIYDSLKKVMIWFPKSIASIDHVDKSIKYMGGFINLVHLDISGNRHLNDNNIQSLTNITVLGLNDNNRITNYGINLMTNITSLDLKNNQMITDDALINLPSITHLNLHENYIITDNGISGLTNITYLDIGFTNISDKGIKNLTKITELSSFRNMVTNVDNLCQLICLRLCNVYNLKFKQPNTCIEELTIISEMPVEPTFLQNVYNVTTLDLYFNKNLNSSHIKHLTNITTLKLDSATGITDSVFKYMTNITDLDLCRNEKISDNGISKLVKLKRVNLQSNLSITYYGISNLTNLKDITLAGPRLGVQPEVNNNFSDADINRLTNLKRLNINNSHTTDKGIYNLTRLVTLLFVDNNNITYRGISNLINLDSVYMTKNSIPQRDINNFVINCEQHGTCGPDFYYY